MSGAGRTRPAPGHNNVWMRTKMNRYDLSLWDVGKRPLYGRETKCVQAATLAGGFMEGTWLTPLPPRRNKTRLSCPGGKVFLRSHADIAEPRAQLGPIQPRRNHCRLNRPVHSGLQVNF